MSKKNRFREYVSARKSLGVKLLVPIAVLQIILIGTLVYLLFALKINEGVVVTSNENVSQTTQLTNDLFTYQKEIETSLLAYRFNQNPEYLNRIYIDHLEIANTLDSLSRVVSGETPQKLIANYRNSMFELQSLSTSLISAIQQGEDQLIVERFEIWAVVSVKVNSALTALVDYEATALKRNANIYQDIINSIYRLTIVAFVATVSLILALYYYLYKNFTSPIANLSHAAKEIAKGNFNVDIEARSGDEIGYLAENLRKMKGELANYYSSLEEEVSKKEEEIRKKQELEERKNEFISAASHELKTPLTSQKVYVQLLKKKAEKNGEKEFMEYLEKIASQTDRLAILVGDLLDLSKIQAGKLAIKKEVFDLMEPVRDLVLTFQQTTETHEITIKGPKNLNVYADKDRLGQVLTNLLTNAVKYSPDGTKIEVEVKKEPKQVKVSVRDRGIGIAKSQAKRIFKRFYRVNEDDVKTYPGLGMGLYIAAQIVKRHGGKIWVESQKGKGATFFFTVPLGNSKPSAV